MDSFPHHLFISLCIAHYMTESCFSRMSERRNEDTALLVCIERLAALTKAYPGYLCRHATAFGTMRSFITLVFSMFLILLRISFVITFQTEKPKAESLKQQFRSAKHSNCDKMNLYQNKYRNTKRFPLLLCVLSSTHTVLVAYSGVYYSIDFRSFGVHCSIPCPHETK